MATIRILYPDVKSVDDFAFERAVIPDGVDLIQYDATEASAIPDDVWRDADAMVTGIRMPIDDRVFERATSCRIITRLGVGYDMIDTAGTLTKAGAAVAEAGAKSVYALATHPVLSGPAVQRISESVFEKVIVTDTIPLSAEADALDKIQPLSVASIFAEAIRSIHFNDSISRLFLVDPD